jgi:hypothetical protein
MSEFGLATIGPKASYALAASIAFASALRFLKWLVPFLFERFDVAEGRLGKRLQHVERELASTRKALFLMLNRMAERYPTDPVLGQVAKILGEAWPVDRETRPAEQELIHKLDQEGGA